MTRGVAAALAVTGVLTLAACGSGSDSGSDSGGGRPTLTVRGAYVPEPVNSDMAGGFFTVENTGGPADKLTSVTSNLSDDVQLHRTVDRQMQRARSLPVPANGELRLGRGGNHLMFVHLKRKPKRGEKVPITLHFAKSAAVKVSVPVEATNHVPEK